MVVGAVACVETTQPKHCECTERSGSVYKQFINLLWVLAGWFVFIAGAYIAATCRL